MENGIPQKNLSVPSEGISHLASIRKWALFLSIMGFIGSGLMVIGGFLFGALSRSFGHSEFGGAFPSILMMVMYIGIGIIYFLPSLYLFKFSANLKSALETYIDTQITEAFNSLRSFFTFIGVLTIIMIVFSVLAIIGIILIGILGVMAAGD